jgi:hypothetical protein
VLRLGSGPLVKGFKPRVRLSFGAVSCVSIMSFLYDTLCLGAGHRCHIVPPLLIICLLQPSNSERNPQRTS